MKSRTTAIMKPTWTWKKWAKLDWKRSRSTPAFRERFWLIGGRETNDLLYHQSILNRGAGGWVNWDVIYHRIGRFKISLSMTSDNVPLNVGLISSQLSGARSFERLLTWHKSALRHSIPSRNCCLCGRLKPESVKSIAWFTQFTTNSRKYLSGNYLPRICCANTPFARCVGGCCTRTFACLFHGKSKLKSYRSSWELKQLNK